MPVILSKTAGGGRAFTEKMGSRGGVPDVGISAGRVRKAGFPMRGFRPGGFVGVFHRFSLFAGFLNLLRRRSIKTDFINQFFLLRTDLVLRAPRRIFLLFERL